MAEIGGADSLGEFLQGPYKAQGRSHHFEDCRCLAVIRGENRGVAWHARENRHFAETGSRWDISDFSVFTRVVGRKNAQLFIEGEIKSVSTPLAFVHDRFTR